MVASVVDVGRRLDSNPENRAISTYHGNVFDITDESTWQFDIKDIAVALANICRYGGHCNFYSVGEHSIRVSDWVEAKGFGAKVVKAALLHDASEAYLLDIPRPWKPLVSIGDESYYEVEDRIQTKLMTQYGVVKEWLQHGQGIIKEADLAIYRDEADSRPGCGRSNVSPHAIAQVFLAKFNGLAG